MRAGSRVLGSVPIARRHSGDTQSAEDVMQRTSLLALTVLWAALHAAELSAQEPFRELAIDPSIAHVLDEAEIDGAEMVELGTLPEPKHAGGLRDFWGYRYHACSFDWIIGKGDQFGAFSLNGDHYQPAGIQSGLGVGLDFHFLSGPVQSEMPPRVFDFSIGYQFRRRCGAFGYDLAASVMASSDFEGSARQGIRYPGHAVGFLQFHPSAELVFGIDYLDREDIRLLPVAGIIWFPRDDLRLDLVFPRPRVTFVLPPRPWWSRAEAAEAETDVLPRVSREHRLYVGGELGGGTWAVQRWESYNDLATYRDLRLSIGLECVDDRGSRSALEVSYLFGRRLEFTSGIDNMRLDDTVMLRWIGSH